MSGRELHLRVVNCGGEEVASVEAQPDWRLPELLGALPALSPLLEQRLLMGQEELREGPSLAEQGLESGAWITRLLVQRRCVVLARGFLVEMLNAATGKCLRIFRGHAGDVASAELSRDGETVLTASRDGTARLWSARTGALLRSLQHDKVVRGATFSLDGEQVLTASGAAAWLWTAAGELCTRFQGHAGHVLAAGFSQGGGEVLTGATDGSARLWSVATGECLQRFGGHAEAVGTVAFCGGEVVTGSEDGTVRMWCAGSGECRRISMAHVKVQHVACSPDGKRLLTTSVSDGTVKIWCCISGEHLRTLRVDGPVWSAAFSPDGQEVVTAASFGCGVQVWCLDTGACLRTLRTGDARSVAFSH